MRLLSMRYKLIIILALAVVVPLIGSGYILIYSAEKAMNSEKESKLYGIARTLDASMEGDFESLLSIEAKSASHDEKVRLLNQRLSGVTEKIVSGNPGVGAGYYSKDLDCIITYGPGSEYDTTVGQSISQEHLGREVMEKGIPLTASGKMVRGNILNAMVPIIRNNNVIGYVWANEMTESIERQINEMEIVMYEGLAIALVVGLSISMTLANRVSNSVNGIIKGLSSLGNDLSQRLPEINGEFGKIASAINGMAQSLMNTRSHTEIIMESMVDGIITIDNDEKITEINAAAWSIMGLNKDVIGVNYKDLFSGNAKVLDIVLETLRVGKKIMGYEAEFTRSDGAIIPISVSTSMLCNNNNVLGVVLVFKDLSEHKAFEDYVRRLDRLAAVGELAAGVAHEIRNPLSAISGSVQILVDELPKDNSTRIFGNVVLKEVDRLNGVIEDLLYFAKPSKHYVTSININELVENSLFLLLPSIKKEIVVLETHFDQSIEAISVDAQLIKQVLVNLLLNATQAMPKENGKITVTTQRVIKGIEIIIEDNGKGIDQESLPRIFDPFFTTKDTGTGLGLAVSNKIIEIHQGYIRAESIVGIGSTFTIYLPYESGIKEV
ncbi:two-component system sensor histidine kinase AtoS [Clostridium beijerinckii]|uniref:two-component system sensor histidine kinase AtoS n=1 Tax=Clostridium beijerinckii TaxID=1520 RepID=UPI0003D31AF2|nr:two-component system sensor histidine kinase AtoS [Clostridium beijerinckii]ALB45005.1 two-component system sensor histidine kinase AtoS [Clostridium beijerinckii NRRL B-598]